MGILNWASALRGNIMDERNDDFEPHSKSIWSIRFSLRAEKLRQCAAEMRATHSGVVSTPKPQQMGDLGDNLG